MNRRMSSLRVPSRILAGCWE